MTARAIVLQLHVAIFLGVFFLCGSQEDREVTKKKLHVAVLVPLPDSRPTFKVSWAGGPAVAPAAIVAAELVNNRTDILPGYELEVLIKDSGCAIQSKAEIAFTDSIFHSGVNVVGVVGPGCTASTKRTGTLAARDSVSIIQIAATATSPELIDGAYSTTFRPVSSQNAHMDAFVKLLEHNYWRRVATLYDGVRPLFFATHDRFTRTVGTGNIVFTSPVFENPFDSSKITLLPLEEIKNLKVRVIYVFTTNGFSGKILCLAHHLNMTYPTYQFLFHGRTLNKVIKKQNFTYDGKRFECGTDLMNKISEGIINTEYLLERADKTTTNTVSGLSYDQYHSDFYEPERDAFLDSPLITSPDGINVTTYSNLYHDSVWALALALNSSIPLLEERGMKLEDYSYGQREATEIIQQQLLEVDFEGMVGRITMQNETRESSTVINIVQVQLNNNSYTRVEIGYYYNSKNFSIEDSGMFINDSFETASLSINIGAGIVSLIATVIGLTLSGWLQMMNILYSNIRRVKATSPNLNHLIFSGCYMFVIAAAVYAIQESFSFLSSPLPDGILCNVFTWCIIMGYSLIFGTVCAKMWRIYTIFNHSRTLKSKRRPGILVTDQALAVFVTFLLMLDTAVCVLWTWTDPWVLETKEHFDVNSAMPVIELQMNCNCQHLTRWIAIVASYKGTVATVIVGLSILNRRIHRKEFQHSKHVTVLVYVLILLNSVGIPLFFILGNLNIHISFFILSIVLNATVILCSVMLFLPPLLPLIRARLQNSPPVTCYRKWTGEYV